MLSKRTPHRRFEARTHRRKVLAGGRLSSMRALRFTSPATCSPSVILPTTCARNGTGSGPISTSTGTSTPTNVCVASCRPLRLRPQRRRARRLHDGPRGSLSDRRRGLDRGSNRIPYRGCLHPDLPFQYYVDLVRGLKERFPSVHVKAFTAGRDRLLLAYYANADPRNLGETQGSGSELAPGRGAEIFAPETRRLICDHRSAPTRGSRCIASRTSWVCHRTPPCSMHIESSPDRVDHLLQLRNLQDETHGFQTFIPLAFHPANTELGKLVPGMRPVASWI